MSYDYLVKVVIIGGCKSGKSELLNRAASNEYQEQYIATVGVDFRMFTTTIHDKVVRFQLWDTSGSERYRAITRAYYKGASVTLIVVDCTNENAIKDLEFFQNAVTEYSKSVK